MSLGIGELGGSEKDPLFFGFENEGFDTITLLLTNTGLINQVIPSIFASEFLGELC